MYGRASLLGALALVSVPAGAATLQVPEDHPTLADAVAAAAAGDVIEVGEGTFAGTALIGIDLTITGAGEGLTVLDGGTGTILGVAGATLTVRDLTLASGLTGGPAVDLSSVVASFERVSFQGEGAYTPTPAVQGVQSDLSLEACTFSDTMRAVRLEQGALDSTDTDYSVSDVLGIHVIGGQATLTGGRVLGSPNGGYSPSIYFSGSPTTLSGVTLDSVLLGGDETSLTVSDSTVTGSGVGLSGYPDFVVERTRFEDLTADYLVQSWDRLTLEDNVFVNCDAPYLVVGFNGWSQRVEARRNVISSSTFEVAVAVSDGDLLFEGNTLSDNEGTLLRLYSHDEVALVGNEFARNAAPGPLVYVDDSPYAPPVRVLDNVFRDNRGSAAVEWLSDVEITHNLFIGHVLEEAPPSSLYTGLLIDGEGWDFNQALVLQNTFAGIEGPGPVVGAPQGHIEMRNNLVVGYRGSFAAVGGDVTLSHNLFWDNAGGDLADGALPATNLSADPLLDTWREGPSTALDLVLLPGSPAIDAGHPDLLDADGSPSDIGYTGGPTADPLLAVDADGDGSSARFDCDDEDGAVFPGQAEACGDEVDADCDGAPDQGLAYMDADGDGLGDPASSVVADLCTLDGASVLGTDCDDTDAGISPEAAETCDGRDEDCDGEVDEGVCGEPEPEPEPGSEGSEDPSKAEDERGCGCTTSGAPGSLGALMALGVLALGRRRRRSGGRGIRVCGSLTSRIP